MDFYSAYSHGFARVAACTIPISVGDPAANAREVIAQARECSEEGVAVAVFPELCLSGYSIEDLVLQRTLLDAVTAAISAIVVASEELLPVIVVGAPLRHRDRVLNTAVVIHGGEVLGVVPKTNLPTYREFYERRWYGSGEGIDGTIMLGGEEVPLSTQLLFRSTDIKDLVLHVEVCEDMWVPVPPSAKAALSGATVLLNLSASPITVGRADARRLLVQSASARCSAAYVFTAAGPGESTTDLSWDGQTMVYELGELLGETERFPDGPRRTVVDVDLERIRAERIRQGTFDDNRRAEGVFHSEIEFELAPPMTGNGLRRKVDRFPFVPDDPAKLAQECYEAYNIQVSGLEKRLQSIGPDTKIVIGVSGGLDSTHALIVAAKAMERLGRPASDILAFTMPGFATSEDTKSNATKLMEALGTTYETLDIRPTATQMLKEIGHPAGEGEPVYDVTFENVQAGLRTDFLFRIANQRGGIVLGTGDLSELALGWATYGVGDQMSHYNVNAGVPKTLIQHLIRWVITTSQFEEGPSDQGAIDAVLQAILDQEISPELVPGEEMQSTEQKIGPYALQDFTLYHTVRHGFTPSKIAYLAWNAWHDIDAGEWPPGFPEEKRMAYEMKEIRSWLEVFVKRFFANQFKRSALPNGPKVSNGGTMSPRGDWRMPSDASPAAWLAEIEARVPVE
ncbi:NAD+ synthase (glutamine-hydrolyzing) [Nocardioides luteus]|uniref:Glutamine-dependent NAD(+) synthetase n=1 Tax=Nocardioides luteus TaxID=1844 RepID=A0ABQ5ST72_9ACTN|nr:NAD(+) synthase [Nocardioides luteus]MDR7311265.1 NAD+ synthase (glutamine-hydrolyzing) [Nocardioides luteus]GGR70910.1 NAD(+) synthase [Nocardioides luteus]GLJ66813.1 NAD(+) synthase [Nocardioides luteus]